MSAFETKIPELQSRSRRIALKYPAQHRQELADDVLSAMFLNHTQAQRKGKELSTCDLGWAGAQHARWRSTAVYARARDERHRTWSIDEVKADPQHPVYERLGAALATDDRANPATRVQIRLDWSAFARSQPRRIQRILLALARGTKKADIAKFLKISPGRLSQILSIIQCRILAFYGAEIPI